MRKEQLKTVIGEGIGEASLLWNPTPVGVFESTKGVELTERLTDKVFDMLDNDKEKKTEPKKSVYPVKVKYFADGLINKEVEEAIKNAIKGLGYGYDGSGACCDGSNGRDLYFTEKK